MKAMIKETITVVCEPGSIVEISEDQFMALGNAAEAVTNEKLTTEKPARKAKEKK